MQKRSLRITPDRSSCGIHSWLQPSKFSQLLLRVSSDSLQGRISNQDALHYSVWHILLYNYAFQTQKCGCNLLVWYTTVSTFTDWVQHGSIC
jgi:hypothetical protein